MRFTVTCDSDIGLVRKINQDAVAVKHASAGNKEVVFAVLCDGMGGLDEGETASASVVNNFLEWFNNYYLKEAEDADENIIFSDWEYIINSLNSALYQYGGERGIKVGTTATVILISNFDYYLLNIGDSRAYELTHNIRQLTDDHSVVAKEVKEGRLSPREARFDSRRNQLLRSVGVTKDTRADFFKGKIAEGAVYMLCCDGVRNRVYDDELLYYFHPSVMTDKNVMQNNIHYIFELNKLREESDNMSVILIKDNETTIVLQNNKNAVVVEEKIITGSKRTLNIDWSRIR